MNNLGFYHYDITKNYEEMEKYYVMAISLENSAAMNNLGHYHQYVTKNYEEMEKYYLMAVHKDGNRKAMNQLYTYYNTKMIKVFELLWKYKNLHTHSEHIISELKGMAGNDEINKHIKSKCSRINNKFRYIYNKYVINNIKFDKGYKTDFTIIAVCNDEIKEYYIDSIVLSSYDYFQVLLYGKFQEVNFITMYVSNFEIISILIKFLYLNEFDVTNNKLDELLSISQQYKINELEELCELAMLIR